MGNLGSVNWRPAAAFRAALVLAVAVVAAGAAVAAGGERLSNAQIVRNFNIIAFGNEYTLKRYERVRKWRAPIVARLDGDAPAYFEDSVRQHLADLAKTTGHPAALVYSARIAREKRVPKGLNPKSFNMFLLFYPMDELAAVVRRQLKSTMDQELGLLRAGKATCMARLFKKGDEIRSAVVLFPAHHSPAYLRACVVEELTQVMGLPNDSDNVNPSIFNDKSRHFELTGHDRLLLRILYDKRMAIGTPRRDALRLAHDILRERRR